MTRRLLIRAVWLAHDELSVVRRDWSSGTSIGQLALLGRIER